ncbi:MAG: glutathione peroxidase [Planctomycetota bacterium]|nr:MAG: glutathione peroxidase [Planctomycetota bacterium]
MRTRTIRRHASFAVVALLGAFAATHAPAASPQADTDDPTYVLDFTIPRLDGSEQSLRDYEGKVILIVNTASKCGLTPQYAGLQKLYERYKDQGFVVLGFPANNFRNQEPGTNKEISEFCTKTYGITFPMFTKISVKGKDIHPLYQRLTSLPEPIGGPVLWNFQKYLVDRTGHVVARFHPTVKPDDPALIAHIEALLKGAN